MKTFNNESSNTNTIMVTVKRKGDYWYEGSCGEYKFRALVFDNNIACSIAEGRVNKLNVWRKTHTCNKPTFEDVADFYHGWNLIPKTEHEKRIVATIHWCLERLPLADNEDES